MLLHIRNTIARIYISIRNTAFGRFRVFAVRIDDVVNYPMFMRFCLTDDLASPGFFTGIIAATAVAFWDDTAAAMDA
jgi:hypothetical protein